MDIVAATVEVQLEAVSELDTGHHIGTSEVLPTRFVSLFSLSFNF
jgi:hypothetical protein